MIASQPDGYQKQAVESLGHAPRILLAEDCPDTLALFSAMLESLGCAVSRVEDGEECVDLIQHSQQKSEPFDLVILDIRMPFLDGDATAKEIRDKGYVGPIVGITASPSFPGKSRSLGSGIDLYASKGTINKEFFCKVLNDLVLQPNSQHQ